MNVSGLLLVTEYFSSVVLILYFSVLAAQQSKIYTEGNLTTGKEDRQMEMGAFDSPWLKIFHLFLRMAKKF